MAKILSRSTASRIANRFFSTSRAASPSPLPSNLISRRSSPTLFHAVGFIPATNRLTTIRTRMDISGGSYSPLKSGSNFSDRPPTESGENANRQQMIDCYVQTLAKIVGSEEEAKRKIYNVSCERYVGFGCEIDKETSNKGISTSRKLQADEEPVSSPLSSPALLGSGKEEEQKIIPKRKKVQAVLKAIKQSPKKVNLVAALVRGMRVEDALMQLQVTVKRASQTVYRVIHAARANASHNHGLDPDRLLIAEAFVGKGLFKKRISYHGKGKCGLMIRPECRLTVIVRETTPEEEAEIARLKVHNFKKLSKRERRLVPHKLIETTPIWNRRGTKANHGSSELVPSH